MLHDDHSRSRLARARSLPPQGRGDRHTVLQSRAALELRRRSVRGSTVDWLEVRQIAPRAQAPGTGRTFGLAAALLRARHGESRTQAVLAGRQGPTHVLLPNRSKAG